MPKTPQWKVNKSSKTQKVQMKKLSFGNNNNIIGITNFAPNINHLQRRNTKNTTGSLSRNIRQRLKERINKDANEK